LRLGDGEVDHGSFGRRNGLQEGAGRQGDHRLAQFHQRLTRAIDGLARQRDPGEVALTRRHSRPHPRVGRKPAALAFDPRHVDVQTRCGQGDVQTRSRFRMLQERLGQARQSRQGRDDTRIGDRTFLDRREVPRAPLFKAQPRAAALAALAGMQGDARLGFKAARGRRRGEGRQNFGLQSLHRELYAHLLGLPGSIGLGRPVLEGAAAAGSEMTAGRRHTIRTRGQDLDDLAARAFHVGQHPFAGEGQGHESRALAFGVAGEAVALRPDRIDRQFSHLVSVSTPRTDRPARRGRPYRVGRKLNTSVSRRSC